MHDYKRRVLVVLMGTGAAARRAAQTPTNWRRLHASRRFHFLSRDGGRVGERIHAAAFSRSQGKNRSRRSRLMPGVRAARHSRTPLGPGSKHRLQGSGYFGVSGACFPRSCPTCRKDDELGLSEDLRHPTSHWPGYDTCGTNAGQLLRTVWTITARASREPAKMLPSVQPDRAPSPGSHTRLTKAD